jgi:hypothetical protein
MHACKRAHAQSALTKNRQRVRVDGRALLARARTLVEAPLAADARALTLALSLLTGRRQCELLNGASRFDAAGARALRFDGQAKRRGQAPAYDIPTLAPAASIVAALRALQARTQGGANARVSARYQSALSRYLKSDAVWAPCGRVHALRGLYACMCIRLFEWGDASDAFVAMRILGHRGLGESLVYTPFDLGEAFAREEPRLGAGVALDADDEEGA